ncbi:MAG: CBS domain-containing protein, partial [Alphaproteobacteria bacterium]|nr:CBS domain-containing protein [Alphaproteobacteria bacterium]
VMTAPVVTIQADAHVIDVARLLLDRHISAVPVVDGDGRLLGIVSEGDLLRRVENDTERKRDGWNWLFTRRPSLAAEYAKSHARRAGDVMTRNVVTVAGDVPLSRICDLFEKHNIKRVPVVRDDRVVGIVSRADLLRALVKQAHDDSPSAPVSDAELAERLAAELRTQKWASSAAAQFEVKNGIVVLNGAVFSDAQRTALRIAAESIPGVRGVQDETVTEPARQGM